MNQIQNTFIEYKKIIEQTKIQEYYQQVIHFLKKVMINLKDELPDYIFMDRLIENQMDFSYFQITNSTLKEKKIKIQVIFIHQTCHFEIWLSGYNRKTQVHYYSLFQNNESIFQLCPDPYKKDYILKKKIESDVTKDDIKIILNDLTESIQQLTSYFFQHLPENK